MSGVDGTLKFDTKLDSSGFENGLSKLGGLAGKALGLVTKTVVAAGGAAAAFGATAIKAGGDFESGMSKVEAIAGDKLEKPLSNMNDLAKELGVSFAEGASQSEKAMALIEAKALQCASISTFTAGQTAEALQYMGMAGWDAAQMMGGLPGIMSLAEASGEDLATTSDIVTDAMTAFGLVAGQTSKAVRGGLNGVETELESTTRFVDVLSQASSASNTNVALMGETFKYVAPVAGALGFQIEDTAWAIGLMANSGIKGSMAGTALRNVFTRMAKPTDESAAAMDNLGISITDESGKMRSLKDILIDLRAGFENMTESEKAMTAAQLAGQQGMSGLLAIVNASEDDFLALGEAIYDCEGRTQDMADQMKDNLPMAVEMAKSALDILKVTMYQSIQTPAKDSVKALSEMINGMTDAFKSGGFEGLAAEAGKSLGNIALYAMQQSPKLIRVATGMIHSFCETIKNPPPEMAGAAGELVNALVEGIASCSGDMISAGIVLLRMLLEGIAGNSAEIGVSIGEAIGQIMQAIKDNGPAIIAAGAEIIFGIIKGISKSNPQLAAVLGVLFGAKVLGSITGGATALLGIIEKIKGGFGGLAGATGGVAAFGGTIEKVGTALLSAGAGFALAGAGMWILVQAAMQIVAAGPEAGIALTLMVSGIAALMVVAGVMAPQLEQASTGLYAFGAAILMAAAGMALMSYAAIQIAQAGPMALAGLSIMVGGLIALLAITAALGPQLTSGAAGLAAFGIGILLAAAGMSIMAMAATQVAAAGPLALGALIAMEVGLIAMMAAVALLGPMLTAASVGIIAFGAGILLAAAGLYVLVQAAIQLSAAGAPAGIALAALGAGLIAFGAVAGLLAPVLLPGAAAIAALGVSLLLVSTAALLGGAALTMITTCLPLVSAYGVQGATALAALGAGMIAFSVGATAAGLAATVAAIPIAALAAGIVVLGVGFMTVSAAATLGAVSLRLIAAALPRIATFGLSGSVAITALGGALAVFAVGAATAGLGAGAAALGFGTLALAATAANLVFAPLAVEMTACATSVAIIAASAQTAASGITGLSSTSAGIIGSMAKLALAFPPVALALAPFAVAATAASVANAALAVSSAGAAVSIGLESVSATALGLAMIGASLGMTQFKTTSFGMDSAAQRGSEAFKILSVSAQAFVVVITALSDPFVQVSSASTAMAKALISSNSSLGLLNNMLMQTNVQMMMFGNTTTTTIGIVRTSFVTAIMAMINIVNGQMLRLPGLMFLQLMASANKIDLWQILLVQKGTTASQALTSTVINGLSSLVSGMEFIGMEVVNGLWVGMDSRWSWLEDQARAKAKSLVDSMAKELKIGSPSKIVANRVGQWLPPGIEQGFSEAMPDTVNKIRGQMSELVESMASTVGTSHYSFGKVAGNYALAGSGGNVYYDYSQHQNNEYQVPVVTPSETAKANREAFRKLVGGVK